MVGADTLTSGEHVRQRERRGESDEIECGGEAVQVAPLATTHSTRLTRLEGDWPSYGLAILMMSRLSTLAGSCGMHHYGRIGPSISKVISNILPIQHDRDMDSTAFIL